MHRYLDIDRKKIEYEEEDLRTQAPDFWEDRKRAEEQMKKVKAIKKWIDGYNDVRLKADILSLGFPDSAFDKVVAGNVIHLLDEPLKALGELNRVCRPGGMMIIPTYMNKDQKGNTSGFASVVGKAGADFKRQFTVESYRQFFLDAGYRDVQVTLAEGRIPCAVAVMTKR